MKVTINTEKLKSMVSRALRGVGNNKLIPITQLINVSVSNNELKLITTDATNYLYIIDMMEADDFDVTVSADIFGKLISKMTSENVTLEVKDGILEVKGNGTYTIELPLDENGEAIKYPNPVADIDESKYKESQVSLSVIRTIIDAIGPSLATTLELPIITNYYVGEKTVATDRYKIACLDNQIIDTQLIISSIYMNLLDVMTTTTDRIKVLTDENTIISMSGDCIVYGKLADTVNDYPYDSIINLLNTDIDDVCSIKKAELLNLLDRMSLFTNDITSRSTPITIKFGADEVTITNKSGKSSEAIKYADDKVHEIFECVINIELLTSQVKAYSGDVIEVHYGNDNLLKFVDGSIIQIVALYSED